MSATATATPISLELRHEILTLTAEHAWRLDHAAADTLHELYAHDGELLNLPPRDLVGRAEIHAWGRERVKLPRVSRHVESNHRLHWRDGVLCGTLYVCVYRSEDEHRLDTSPLMVGDYEDVYVQESGRWVIRRRVIHKAFRAAR